MKFLISGELGTDPGTGGNSFAYIASTLTAYWNTLGGPDRASIVPSAMNLSGMVLSLQAAPGAGNSRTFAVHKNGAPTALTVTISDTATQAAITGQSIAYAAGDTISMAQIATTGAPVVPGRTRWSIVAESVGGEYFNVFGGSVSTVSATGYRSFQNMGATWLTSQADAYQVFPLSGTLTAFYVSANYAPGAGSAWDVSVLQNGIASAATLHYDATEFGTKAWSGSVAIIAGDTLALEALKTGTANTNFLRWSATIVPDTPGESAVMSGSPQGPSTTAVNYDEINAVDGGWTPYLSIRYSMLHDALITQVYAQIGTAPGGAASWKFTLSDNNADAAAAVTIAGAATTGNASCLVDTVAGHLYALKCTPAGSPAAMTGGAHVSFRILMRLPGADLAGDALAQASASGSLSEQYQPTAIAKWANIAAHRDWANVATHRNWGNP